MLQTKSPTARFLRNKPLERMHALQYHRASWMLRPGCNKAINTPRPGYVCISMGDNLRATHNPTRKILKPFHRRRCSKLRYPARRTTCCNLAWLRGSDPRPYTVKKIFVETAKGDGHEIAPLGARTNELAHPQPLHAPTVPNKNARLPRAFEY